jgi:hypothetical protein
MSDFAFREIELDRESRIPDEPYKAPCTERGPLASPPCPEADDGAHRAAPSASPRSVEDVEQSWYGRDPFGRPDPRTHPEFWTE